MTAKQARQVIKNLADNEAVVMWSNDLNAAVDGDGDLWINGDWANEEQLVAFAEWLEVP